MDFNISLSESARECKFSLCFMGGLELNSNGSETYVCILSVIPHSI